MKTVWLVGLGGAALLAMAPAPAMAGGTKVFRQTSAKDFDEGEATGSRILPSGEVAAGMKAARVPLDAAFVWCSALTKDGGTAYFGTGDDGKIFAVDSSAAAASSKTEKPARKIADLDAAWVTALAVRPDGQLLAGATPGGRVYLVDPRSGSAHELAKLPAEHVWSLAYDATSGTTYVGTGLPGKIFAVDSKGKSRAIWDSGDKHVVSLLRAADGRLLAGTSEEGILFRVATDGHAEALHDFEAEEVRAIARDGDTIFVAVNDFEKTAAPVVPGPVAAKGTRVTVSAATGAPTSAGALPRPGQRKSKAGLYRLESDGRIEQIFSTADGYFTSLQLDTAGGVYVATGTQGKVYHVAKDRSASLAVDLPERQALTLAPAGAGLLIGSGDVGGVYRARPAVGDEASYLSKVMDAEYPARWGMARWHGTPGLTVETRSGNTAKPDTTWAPWRRVERPQATASGSAGAIVSSPGRYLQYRVGLSGPTGRLRDMSLYYLPQNQRARITEITVADPPATPPVAGAARVHSAVVKLRWKVENVDGDELTYRVVFHEQGESTWRPLGGPDPLSKAEYDWNTEGLPDGYYVVRVTASDEKSNPRERALDFALESAPLLVDNRPPEVVEVHASYPQITGRAKDGASNITDIEYTVDGGDWHSVAPSDGILDDPVEAFSFRLPTLAPGPHAVTVRAWDSGDNVGAAGITVTVK